MDVKNTNINIANNSSLCGIKNHQEHTRLKHNNKIGGMRTRAFMSPMLFAKF